MSLSLILFVVLLLMLVGSLPAWRYSRGWGYAPSGGVGTILLVLIIFMIMWRI